MSTINGIEQSTYRSSYLGKVPTLPFIKYKNLPCLYVYANVPKTSDSDRSYKVIPLTRGKKPVPQPQVYKTTQDNLITLAPVRPKSSKGHAAPSRKVFDTKYGPMDSVTIDTLYNKRRYSTSTQTAAQEFALPVAKIDIPKTTQKPKADMVRLRAQRYEDKADVWQDAVLWDRIQSRCATQGYGNSTSDKTLPLPPSARKVTNLMDQMKQETIISLVKNEGLANVFVRKCPGYAGYVPLCPPETRLDDKKAVNSIMTSSYSKLPDTLYTGPTKHRKKTSFSQTVTLTSPLNPFNKIGQEGVRVDKESRYTNMKEYLSVLPY